MHFLMRLLALTIIIILGGHVLCALFIAKKRFDDARVATVIPIIGIIIAIGTFIAMMLVEDGGSSYLDAGLAIWQTLNLRGAFEVRIHALERILREQQQEQKQKDKELIG